MNASPMVSVYNVAGETRKIEINPKRVAEWVLIFTNAFFVSFFFGRLFGIL